MIGNGPKCQRHARALSVADLITNAEGKPVILGMGRSDDNVQQFLFAPQRDTAKSRLGFLQSYGAFLTDFVFLELT